MKRKTILATFTLSAALVVAGCAGSGTEPADGQDVPAADEQEPGDGEQAEGVEPSDSQEAEGEDGEDAGSKLDADGVVEPGEVVDWELGQPVSFYSMGVDLGDHGRDDVQAVTIEDFEYIDKADLPADVEADEVGDGVLVLTVSWESVAGSVQSNNSYIKGYLESNPDEHAHYMFFREDKLQNGGVPAGTTETGSYTLIIDRGPTTLTLEDYTQNPVANLELDTSQ